MDPKENLAQNQNQSGNGNLDAEDTQPNNSAAADQQTGGGSALTLVDDDGEYDDLDLLDDEDELIEEKLVSEDDYELAAELKELHPKQLFDYELDNEEGEDSDNGENNADNDAGENLTGITEGNESDLSGAGDQTVNDEEKPKAGSQPLNRAEMTEAQFYAQVTELAKAEVKRITGEEYDEFDAAHKIILGDQAAKIIQTQKATASAHKQADAIYAEAGEGFDKFLQNKMQDLSVKQYNALLEAERAGDFSKTLEIMKSAAEEFKGNAKKADVQRQAAEKARQLNQQQAPKKKETPPQMIRPGAGNRTPSSPPASKAVFGLADIGMSDDEI